MRLLLALIFILSTSIAAEEIRKGTVTGSKLRMRAKPGTRYEVLGQLVKGDAVKVVAENNGWLKIVAPDSVTGWISNKFVDHGEITGNDINIRAGANIAYTIFGKLHKGDKVDVLEIKNEVWAKIKAPVTAHAWVSAAYVKLEPMIVARNDEENNKLNDVQAVATPDDEPKDKDDAEETLKDEKDKATMLKELELKLAAEKKSAEDAKKQLAELLKKKEENEKELARLEEERKAAIDAKLADEKKFLVISKLLEEEIKKRSTKLLIAVNDDNSILLGQQSVSKEELLTAFSATGRETVAFVIASGKADQEKLKQLTTALREINPNVFLEDPAPLIKSKFIVLPEEMKKDTKLLQSTFITIEVKKDNSIIVAKIPTPREYLGAVLLSYRENFGNSSVFIKSEKGSSTRVLDELMQTVQKCDFKLINYPSLMSQLKDAESKMQEEELLETTELVNEVTLNDDRNEEALAPGRVKMSGFILQIRDEDKHLVDFALAARVGDQFYAIAYLKGLRKELQSFYLKEVEIIGVSKRLEGWTRPILYVEEFKPLSK